jgi:hypothetical protein
MARALNNEDVVWVNSATELVREIPTGWEGLGEDIRLQLIEDGMWEPHTYHCWGALIGRCVRRGWFVWIGELASPKDTPSHASKTMKYRRTEKR